MSQDVQRYRIVGGPQQMSIRLAEKIRSAGGVVRLSTPVRQIRYSADGVVFVTTHGDVFNGKYAILTCLLYTSPSPRD